MKTRTQKQYSKPFKRRIHLDNGEWSYRIANGWLWVRSPDGNATIKMNFATFTGIGLESDDWGSCSQPKVTIRPSDIKDFIENTFTPVKYPEGNEKHFRRQVAIDYQFCDDDCDDCDEEPDMTGAAIIPAEEIQKDGVSKFLNRYNFDPSAAPWFLPEELDALLQASAFFEGEGTPYLRDGLRPYHETALLKLRKLFKTECN